MECSTRRMECVAKLLAEEIAEKMVGKQDVNEMEGMMRELVKGAAKMGMRQALEQARQLPQIVNEAPDPCREYARAHNRPTRHVAEFHQLHYGGDELEVLLTPRHNQLRWRAIRIDQSAEQNIRVENDTHQVRLANRSARTSVNACSISSSITSGSTPLLCA